MNYYITELLYHDITVLLCLWKTCGYISSKQDTSPDTKATPSVEDSEYARSSTAVY